MPRKVGKRKRESISLFQSKKNQNLNEGIRRLAYEVTLSLLPPKLSQSVHREECTQCFDNQDGPDGIDVCLDCFNGGCLDKTRHHALTHARKSGHSFTLNVKRKVKQGSSSSSRGEDGEPPSKMTKLAIVEEREQDKYEHVTVVKCWECGDGQGDGVEIPDATSDPKIQSLVEGVMQSASSARQSEIKAWEEDITSCEHTLTLEQFEPGTIPAFGLAHCNQCDLKENLWLCLTCASLGCGRQQFGGVQGNSHSLQHYRTSGHPVSVKLGTITPEGGADVYCYACDDSKQDPAIDSHLANFGINVHSLTKTELNMTELQIEHNLKYDFSLTGDDGKALDPVFGPGLTGLSNLGNSCYMASVLQMIFSLPAFQQRYHDPATINHAETCVVPLPADCMECQMNKVADGLLSGRYSHPANAPPLSPVPSQAPSTTPVFQTGLKPATFKALIGKGHQEFATMRQQDAEEFFTHLLTMLKRDGQKYKERAEQDPSKIFSYALEQRLQCTSCNKVRYRTDTAEVLAVSVPAIERRKDENGKTLYQDVELTDCIEGISGMEGLEYSCPECKRSVNAVRQFKFASLPEILVVHAKKFQLVNWVPEKLEIPIIVPDQDQLVFTDANMGRGHQPGEIELPNDAASAPALPEFNANAMAHLEGMGFPTVRCQKALLATGNGDDVETAMEWLFAHMDDTDIDAPIQQLALSSSPAERQAASEPDPTQVAVLADMGFSVSQARKALRETGSDLERAVEWLFSHPDDTGEETLPSTSAEPSTASTAAPAPPSGLTGVPARYNLLGFISHKGPSVHSGHYVAHIRKGEAESGGGGGDDDDGWVLFNDEKVVKADAHSVEELKKLAYLYFFVRS